MQRSLLIPAHSSLAGLTPVDVAAGCRSLPGLVFLDTATEVGDAFSIVAAAPSEIVAGSSASDWELLRAKLHERQREGEADSGMPAGFAAGFVEYDGRFCFGFYDDLLLYRHGSEAWHGVGSLADRLDFQTHVGRRTAPHFSATISREQFCAMVSRAKEFIAAGDIYQVNLSHRLEAAWEGDALRFYEALRHYSPAPYAAYLDIGGRTVLSSSPECFLKMSGRAIATRPIKGTRPRLADLAADEKSAFDLVTSPKEIAELVMITDLERNDLGQVCEYGSVRVKELLKLERYEQVFHLVSTVEGHLREEVDHVTALRSCFPGGSITGAPKKRAREIIAELEPAPRGLYTGAIGYFGFNGESQFNVAIRTVVIENGTAHFHVGAGIVADSIAEKEYVETLDKAAGILLAAERLGG